MDIRTMPDFILAVAIQNFLDNQPATRLMENFKNGKLDSPEVYLKNSHKPDESEGYIWLTQDEYHVSAVFRADIVNIIPGVLESLMRLTSFQHTINVEYKGKSYEVKVKQDYDRDTVECSSRLFNELAEIARIRSED